MKKGNKMYTKTLGFETPEDLESFNEFMDI